MINQYKACSDTELLSFLAADNKAAFEFMFNKFNAELYRFAFRYVKSKEVAEEIVQDVFVAIWQKRKEFQLTGSLSSYLYTSIKHRSLNYLKSQFARYSFEDVDNDVHAANHSNTEEQYTTAELEQIINQAIDSLPEKCRIIFNLSRQEGLTYKEIAEQLAISSKTVEAQMGIALKKLRQSLLPYLGSVIMLIILLLLK